MSAQPQKKAKYRECPISLSRIVVLVILGGVTYDMLSVLELIQSQPKRWQDFLADKTVKVKTPNNRRVVELGWGNLIPSVDLWNAIHAQIAKKPVKYLSEATSIPSIDVLQAAIEHKLLTDKQLQYYVQASLDELLEITKVRYRPSGLPTLSTQAVFKVKELGENKQLRNPRLLS